MGGGGRAAERSLKEDRLRILDKFKFDCAKWFPRRFQMNFYQIRLNLPKFDKFTKVTEKS